MQDIIYIKDLRVQTIIGIFGWEREVRQEVSIDLEMVFDCKRAAKTDTIEDTIDYKKITKGIIQFVEESEFQLQETLAESIAELIFSGVSSLAFEDLNKKLKDIEDSSGRDRNAQKFSSRTLDIDIVLQLNDEEEILFESDEIAKYRFVSEPLKELL